MEEYRQLFRTILLATGEALIILVALGIFFRGRKTKNPHDTK